MPERIFDLSLPVTIIIAALTLDQIYAKAGSDWLKKRKDATTYFEVKNKGMISSCGYVPDGCQDDCFVGINIALIEAID